MAKEDEVKVPPYDKVRQITEKALEAHKDNDDQKGNELVDEAKSVSEEAVKDVHEELEQDASSEHDPAKLNSEVVNGRNGYDTLLKNPGGRDGCMRSPVTVLLLPWSLLPPRLRAGPGSVVGSCPASARFPLRKVTVPRLGPQ